MRQQINLYAADLFGPRVALPAMLLARLFALLLVLLAGFGAWQHWQLSAVHARIQELQSGVDQLASALDTREAALRARHDTSALERRLASLERERNAKQAAIGRLSGRDLGNPDGFAEQLAGLGRHPPDGLWLRGIHLTAGGRALLIEGSTLDGAQLPRYLDALASEPWFAGTPLSVLSLRRPDPGQSRLDFRIMTPCLDPNGQRLTDAACETRIRQAIQP